MTRSAEHERRRDDGDQDVHGSRISPLLRVVDRKAKILACPPGRSNRRCETTWRTSIVAAVNDLAELARLLRSSSDAENPSADELRALLERARRIAVVGLSRSPQKPARAVPAYLSAKGYDIVPINPRAERLLGRSAYAKLGDVHDPVDMVLVFRPSAEAGAVVREASARPERPAIWLQEGIRADPEIAAARAAGLTCVQDLCAYHVHRALHA
jgi:predicted CoA-binding protein